MPPKPAEGSTALRGLNPTQSEIKLLYGILENLVSPIDANWENAAASAGLKDTKSCKEMWRRFRVKYGLDNPETATAVAKPSAVASAKKSAGDADGGGIGGTPVKRGRGRPKKMLLTPGAGADQGDALATPGTAMGNLSFNDMTPETPSKSAFGTATKRSATEADPDGVLMEETPAKKKPAARKPRLSAKQKAAAAAAAQAEAEAQTEAATDAGATGDSNGNHIDAAMEGISQAAEAIADTLAAAAADDGYTTATEGGGVDFGEI